MEAEMKLLGGATQLANVNYSNITVSTTPTLIVASNPFRRGLIIDNTSLDIIYIGPDTNITTTNAVRLKESAQFGNGIPDGYKGAIYGIVAANTSDVAIVTGKQYK